MLECINYNCISNKKGKCYEEITYCESLIRPTHTPSYAEEQLEHAIEKENNIPVNYKDECKRLNKEILDLEIRLNNQSISIKEYMKENEGYKSTLEVKEDYIKELENIRLEAENNINDKTSYIHDLQVSHNIIEQENNKLQEDLKTKEELLQRYYADAKEKFINQKGTEIYINDLKEERDKYKKENSDLIKMIKYLANLL